jgi:hypothetical protein
MAYSYVVNVCMQLPDSIDPESMAVIDCVLLEGRGAVKEFPSHLFFRYQEDVPRYRTMYSPLGVGRYNSSLSQTDGFGSFLQTSVVGVKDVDGYYHLILFFDWIASLGVKDQVIGYVQNISHPEDVIMLVCKGGKLYADPEKKFSESCQLVNP